MQRTIPRYNLISNPKKIKPKKVCSLCGKPYQYAYRVEVNKYTDEKKCYHDERC